jgi:hypothetical protein
MPNDATELQYRLALMWETISVALTLLTVRLHLKSITPEQKEELKKRTEFVQKRIRVLNNAKELLLRND